MIFMKPYIKNSRGERLWFCPLQFARLKLQRPATRALRLILWKTSIYPARAPRLDPLPHFLLQGDWGFCLSYNQFQRLTEDVYDVYIDSSLKEGTSPMLNTTSQEIYPTRCWFPRGFAIIDVQRYLSGYVCQLSRQRTQEEKIALLLSVSVHPWHHRSNHLAISELNRRSRKLKHAW